MNLSKFITCILLTLLPQLTFAAIYKCKTSSGKTVYSESECPSNTSGTQINLDSNVIDSSAIRNKIANEKTHSNNVNSKSTPAINTRPSDNLMTTHDKQLRLSGLSIDMNDDRAFSEKIVDAKNEHAYLSGTAVHNLSYEDELKRRNLKIDLNSPDASKRSNAFQELLTLYKKYTYQ